MSYLRNNVLGLVAIFIALSGSAYAVGAARNSVGSKQIKAGAVKNADLGSDAVTSPKVKDGTLLNADFAAGQIPAGPRGLKGDAGTARAYGRVVSNCGIGDPCPVDHAKGITSVTKVGTGDFCITAPGIDPSTTSPVATSEYESSQAGGLDEAQAEVQIVADPQGCGNDGRFEVLTYTRPAERVRNANYDLVFVTGYPDRTNNVGFTIVIP